MTPKEFYSDAYYPGCERLDTAVKAIWLLYRRGRWGCLAAVNLPRHQVEEDFARFDYDHIASEKGRIRTEEQVFTLIRYCPLVLPAALEVMKRYTRLTSVSRADYFAHRKLVEELFAELGPWTPKESA